MPEIEVVCPSGLEGVARGWKTKEANILANKKDSRTGASFDKMLQACWVTTTDPGVYTGVSNGSMNWAKALTCDRFWALLRIRAATFGDEYEFDVPCQDRGMCGKKIPWECNLSELPFKPLPDESRAKIAAGDNRFQVELMHGDHAGKQVFFRLQNGDGEKRGAKMVRGQDTRIIVASLATRIIEVEGVEKGGLVRFLDDLEMADLMHIIDSFDEHDGGVETTIEIECNHCGLLQDIELPLGQGFWLPRKKRKSRTSPLDAL